MTNSIILSQSGEVQSVITTPPRISQQPDYSLDNDKLYPKTLLNKTMRNLFITIPHTDISHITLISALNDAFKLDYIVAAIEQHQDGDTHIHALLICKSDTKTRIKPVHNIIKAQNKSIRGTIDYQSAQNIQKVINYIKKDNNYTELGTIPTKTGSVGKQSSHPIVYQAQQDEHYKTAYEILTDTQDKDQVIEHFKANMPRDYFLNYDKIEQHIDKILQPKHKKFQFIKSTPQNTTLNTWQTEVWELLQSQPKTRRIIWVYGEPAVGKSFMFNYLADNYEYGLYQAGQSVSLDNLAYTYNEEGLIAWDIPLNFNWKDLTIPLCNVIEKFSDFGQLITSKKYAGKQVRVLGHAVVFSNNLPPDELSHRDIHLITARNPIPHKIINNKYVAAHHNSLTTSTAYYYYDTEEEMRNNYYTDIKTNL